MTDALDETKLAAACEDLAKRDARLRFIFQKYGAPPLWARAEGFATLVQIILEQQVSLASAKAAFDKLQTITIEITPEAVLSLTDAQMKAAYFSRQKIVYARELARAVLEKRLRPQEFKDLRDEAIRSELTKVKGVGNWTADIYLLMAMLRPDVMPKGDLALHAAWQRLENLPRRPTAEEFVQTAQKWKPYRSAAARLLWHFYLNR